MNAKELARQELEEYKKNEKSSPTFSNDKLPFIKGWGDGEERIIRVLPPKGALKWLIDHPDKFFDDYTELEIGPGAAWEPTYQHFDVGSGGACLPCLKHSGRPCPVCEAYEEDVNSDNAAIKKSANVIRCQHKVSYFVEWRGHEEESPFDWSMAPKWSSALIALIAQNYYTLLYDPFKGHDISVTRTGLDRDNTDYSMIILPDETYLYGMADPEDDEFEIFDFEKARQVLNILPDVSKVHKPDLNYEEYTSILNNEKTVKEVYQEKFGNKDDDDGTDFDKDKLEKESQAKSGGRRRRR